MAVYFRYFSGGLQSQPKGMAQVQPQPSFIYFESKSITPTSQEEIDAIRIEKFNKACIKKLDRLEGKL